MRAKDAYRLIVRRGGMAPALFADMPWSTNVVFEKSLERARAAGLSVAELRRLGDIDTLEDWRHWLRTRPL